MLYGYFTSVCLCTDNFLRQRVSLNKTILPIVFPIIFYHFNAHICYM